jgi:hypothetical protein
MQRAPEQLPLLARLKLIERNPLTMALERFDDDMSLAIALRRNPFAGGAPGISYQRRIALVDDVSSLVAVTPTMLAGARALHNALFASLDRQNPLHPNTNRRIFSFSSNLGNALQSLPWTPEFAGGLVFAGWTGTGKSRTVERFLELIPQVIVHEANPEYGWTAMRQLVWLKVHMPADGSKSGLVAEMMMQIDRSLGTDYSSQYLGRSWTVEKLLVAVIYILLVHRCGLVVIDESQAKNLSVASRFGAEFIQFFLRLLNAGMGVAVVGNPLAFDELRSSAQTEARLTEYGWFNFMPITDATSESWTTDVVKGVWKQAHLLDEPDEEFEGLPMLLLEQTGGVLRYVARLRRVTLALGLRTKAPRVTEKLILMAANSPEMAGIRGQATILAQRDLAGLARWRDLPSDLVRAAWTRKIPGSGVSQGAMPSPQRETPTEPRANRKPPKKTPPTQAAAPSRRHVPPNAAKTGVSDYLSDDFRKRLMAELQEEAMEAPRR